MIRFGVAFRFWLKLGFINFGGPAGQIAMIHKELVDRKRWISEEQFLRALNFCMILPGPEAQQLAVYVGWRLHGIWGGVVAGSFFVIPSILVLLVLSWLAAAQADVPWIAGLFYGIKPVVIAIVIEAVLRIGRRALVHRALIAFAVLAFIAISWLSLPFPLVIGMAALGGVLLERWRPHIFRSPEHASDLKEENSTHVNSSASVSYPPLSRAVRIAFIFLMLWMIPTVGLWLWRGGADVLVQEALFFTKAAFVTFGGAYAVLSYIAKITVDHYHWLTAAQMIQGLGLAESTPGPLIMVTQYVGFLGAWKFHGDFDPLLYGVLGAFVTTYTTFLPCFFFIFVGAPYIEALAENRRIQAALVGVTSAVVGVILNLAVFFATRVVFPDHGTMDVFAIVLAVSSFVFLWRFRMPIQFLVPMSAVIGMFWYLS